MEFAFPGVCDIEIALTNRSNVNVFFANMSVILLMRATMIMIH